MIKSFRCKDTAALFAGETPKRLQAIQETATRKLRLLDAAHELKDLRLPLGNRLEALSGNRNGQYSIRINVQWRICFIWTTEGPVDIEIIDYH